MDYISVPKTKGGAQGPSFQCRLLPLLICGRLYAASDPRSKLARNHPTCTIQTALRSQYETRQTHCFQADLTKRKKCQDKSRRRQYMQPQDVHRSFRLSTPHPSSYMPFPITHRLPCSQHSPRIKEVNTHAAPHTQGKRETLAY